MGIGEYVTATYPCCDTVNADKRHARVCPRAKVQMIQHQPFLHKIPPTLKQLKISHQAESGEPFTADQHLRKYIVIRRGGLRDAPNSEDRDQAILTGYDSRKPAIAGKSTRRRRGPRRISYLYLSGAQAPTLRSSGTSVLRRAESQT